MEPDPHDVAWLDRERTSRPKGSSPARGGMFDPALVAGAEEDLRARVDELDELIADYDNACGIEAARQASWERHYHRWLVFHGREEKSAEMRLAGACFAPVDDGRSQTGQDLRDGWLIAKASTAAAEKKVRVALAQCSAAQSLLRDVREHLA